MARLRVFIAVDPGKSIRSSCVSLQETLARSGADVRWVEPDSIHITLLFLGEVGERELLPVCRAVSNVCSDHQPFVLSVQGVGCFPNMKRPRTVWVGVGSGTEELKALHDQLEMPLVELGYRREDRAYTPHLTIGRVRGDGPMDRLTRALTNQEQWQGGEIEIGEILVMSSDLRPEGPIYSVLSTSKLGKRIDEGE